jgi:hypothetical protein
MCDWAKCHLIWVIVSIWFGLNQACMSANIAFGGTDDTTPYLASTYLLYSFYSLFVLVIS